MMVLRLALVCLCILGIANALPVSKADTLRNIKQKLCSITPGLPGCSRSSEMDDVPQAIEPQVIEPQATDDGQRLDKLEMKLDFVMGVLLDLHETLADDFEQVDLNTGDIVGVEDTDDMYNEETSMMNGEEATETGAGEGNNELNEEDIAALSIAFEEATTAPEAVNIQTGENEENNEEVVTPEMTEEENVTPVMTEEENVTPVMTEEENAQDQTAENSEQNENPSDITASVAPTTLPTSDTDQGNEEEEESELVDKAVDLEVELLKQLAARRLAQRIDKLINNGKSK